MKSSYLTNLGLLLLIVIVYWLNQTDFNPTPIPNKLTQLKPSSINQITIEQAHRTPIIITKQHQQWQLTQPVQAKANPTRIKLLLSLLSQPIGKQHAVNAQTNLSSFGIAQDSLQLQLNDHQFTFGNLEPISQKRYLLYQNQLFLVEDTVAPLLNTTATNLIDNQIIHGKLTKLTVPYYQQQQLTQQHVTLILEQGHWQASEEQNFSTDELTQLIEKWQHSKALQVLPYQSIESKLTQPQQRVELTVSDKSKPISLSLYLDKQHFFIINPESQLAYQFSHRHFQQLLLPIE